MKKLIINLIAIMILLPTVFLLVSIVSKNQQDCNEQNAVLKQDLDQATQHIDFLEKQRDTLEIIIEVAYNSAVTFERLVGVKEPDGIVTYKEKLLITNENIKKINKAKLD